MKNPRITPRERGLIKGALRRVFSRSELRRAVIDASIVQHSDPQRPRVKKWCRCNVCKQPEAKSYMECDHLKPVVPVNTSFEDMSVDNFIDNLWCLIHNLQSICPKCHDLKTAEERKERKKRKK
jgi:HNH endonuclease